jgi:hypothetical protein
VCLTVKNSFEQKKNTCLIKKIKSVFKGSKSQKMTKTHFWQKLKIKFLPKSAFDLKAQFLKCNPKQALSQQKLLNKSFNFKILPKVFFGLLKAFLNFLPNEYFFLQTYFFSIKSIF